MLKFSDHKLDNKLLPKSSSFVILLVACCAQLIWFSISENSCCCSGFYKRSRECFGFRKRDKLLGKTKSSIYNDDL